MREIAKKLLIDFPHGAAIRTLSYCSSQPLAKNKQAAPLATVGKKMLRKN
jgi:hypothetical protein